MGNFEFRLNMSMSQFLFSLILFFPTFQGEMEKELQITEDLSPQLEIFKENIFVSGKDQRTHAVHLPLDLAQYHGDT